jgi:hypothetical protein
MTMPEFQNIALLPGEEVVFAADFTPHPILRSQKAGLLVTRQRVAVLHPQHIFLFFRVGQLMSSSPIESICEVSVGRLLSRHHLRMAMIFAFSGLFIFMFFGAGGGMIGAGVMSALSILIALMLFGAAAFQIWMARSLGLTVQHFGGGTLGVGVDSAEHQAMVHAAKVIQQLMVDARSGTKRPIATGPTAVHAAATNSTSVAAPLHMPMPQPTWPTH